MMVDPTYEEAEKLNCIPPPPAHNIDEGFMTYDNWSAVGASDKFCQNRYLSTECNNLGTAELGVCNIKSCDSNTSSLCHGSEITVRQDIPDLDSAASVTVDSLLTYNSGSADSNCPINL